MSWLTCSVKPSSFSASLSPITMRRNCCASSPAANTTLPLTAPKSAAFVPSVPSCVMAHPTVVEAAVNADPLRVTVNTRF